MANLFRCGAGSGVEVYYLGEGIDFNIKELLPDVDYTKLTVDNFIVGASEINGYTSDSIPAVTPGTHYISKYHYVKGESISVKLSYNNSTGILEVKDGLSQTYDIFETTSPVQSHDDDVISSGIVTHTLFAYLIIGEIKDATAK